MERGRDYVKEAMENVLIQVPTTNMAIITAMIITICYIMMSDATYTK